MTNRENEPPFDGDDLPPDIEALLRAFPERLDRLKEASGLSWSGLARAIGVDRKQTRRWGQYAEPRGGSILSIFHFGDRIPGGLDILLGRDTEPELPDDEEEEEDEGQGEEEEEEQEPEG